VRVHWTDARMSPRKWLKATFLTLFFLAWVYAIARPMLQTYLLAHPHRQAAELTPATAGGPVERVSFRATDGVELVGWFVPAVADGATVVVSHGSGANGPSTYAGVAFLSDAGYNVFVFDHRAHGQSAGQATTLGPREVRDLLGAVAYLRSRPDVDPHRIGAIGCSMGSGVVIGAAAEDEAIRAVVAESVFADMATLWDRFGYTGIKGTSLHWSWGLPMRWATWLWTGEWNASFRPEELIGCITPRPVLIIHGQEDNAACTVADAERLYRAAREPKDLWVVAGAGHCAAHAAQRQPYEDRVLLFFDQALRDDS